jgi:hypothetical protein
MALLSTILRLMRQFASMAAVNDRKMPRAIDQRTPAVVDPVYVLRRNIMTNGIAAETSDSIAVIAVVTTSGPGVPFDNNP